MKMLLKEQKNYHEGHILDVNPQSAMEYVFPELKESEDERIRKELIEALKQLDREKCPVYAYPYLDWAAWLEKQGELKQNGNAYTIIEKEKKVTYKDIARELFGNKPCFYISTIGELVEATQLELDSAEHFNNCTSKKQIWKLFAINKLMNVAKYLNGDWQPDWDNIHETKWYINFYNDCNEIKVNHEITIQNCTIYFKFEELAKQAIEILGEETIKLALCTDY